MNPADIINSFPVYDSIFSQMITDLLQKYEVATIS